MKQTINFFRRHKFISAAFVIAAVYLIVRICFIPPILSDTHFSHAYYDRNGRLLRLTLSADDKYRLYTPLSQIAPDAARAIILYEDKYFYWHPGINPVSLIKATTGYFGGATRPVGASTITMQVARLKYNLNTKKPAGKLKQIAAAIYIDAFHSKREILEAYLNLAPYGGNIEGIGAASLIFFQKRAGDLTTIESITLATIPQNPTRRNISNENGLNNIMHMRGDLVRRWRDAYGENATLTAMSQMPLTAHGTRELPFLAPHFINQEISHKNYWNNIGPHKTEITTTLDTGVQDAMTHALTSQISRRKSVGVTNAAAVLINYKTMETIGYIGSADYFNRDIFGENDGVRARRSPGSTLKPLIYAAAVNRGIIHGMTLLKDARVNFGVYAPENADNEFYGPVLAHTALTHSRNIPAINLLRQIGIRDFHALLSRSGVSYLKSPEYYGVSVALGGAEVSMWELVDIYATMANLGSRREIKTSMDADADEIDSLLSPEAYFLTLDMLARQKTPTKNVPFAKQHTEPLRHYWKTGTSSSFRDAWTAGIFGDFVLIVWVGNFDGTPNNAFSGAKTAAPIYFAVADAVREHYARHGIKIHDNNFMRDDLNISQIDMCDGVGGIAGAHCPHPRPSYFIPGVSPIEMSSVYRAVAIDNKTGLRACAPNPQTTHIEIYEFWDAEYLDIFKRAGITRKTPPPYMPGCDLDTISTARTQPIITSPADGTRTVVLTNANTAPISIRAVTDMTDAKIFWFLDGDVIGTSMPGETFTQDIAIGEHKLRAVDEMGAATEIKFMVVK